MGLDQFHYLVQITVLLFFIGSPPSVSDYSFRNSLHYQTLRKFRNIFGRIDSSFSFCSKDTLENTKDKNVWT